MIRRIEIAAAAVWLASAGCALTGSLPALEQPAAPVQRARTAAPRVAKQPQGPDDLPFSIRWSSTAKPEDHWMKWDATYTSHGKRARFRLELTAGTPVKDSPFIGGHGFFYRVPGSDCGGLLADLKPALGAKHLPKRGKRVDRLAFDLAILGVNQSKAPATANSYGGFQSDPPGDWMPVKIFLPDDIEFFLDINTKAGKAEFSMKDDSYGDEILKQLATVL